VAADESPTVAGAQRRAAVVAVRHRTAIPTVTPPGRRCAT
jgi:hypothetical protein